MHPSHIRSLDVFQGRHLPTSIGRVQDNWQVVARVTCTWYVDVRSNQQVHLHTFRPCTKERCFCLLRIGRIQGNLYVVVRVTYAYLVDVRSNPNQPSPARPTQPTLLGRILLIPSWQAIDCSIPLARFNPQSRVRMSNHFPPRPPALPCQTSTAIST